MTGIKAWINDPNTTGGTSKHSLVPVDRDKYEAALEQVLRERAGWDDTDFECLIASLAATVTPASVKGQNEGRV